MKNKLNGRNLFCIFSYSGDASIIYSCIKSILSRADKEAIVCVFDDANDPMVEDRESFERLCLIHKIERGSVRYKRTSFKRNGNLRGRLCFAEMINAMCTEMRALFDIDWIIKVDPDTIVSGMSWLDAAKEADVLFTGGEREPVLGSKPLSGVCYAVRKDLLLAIRRLASSWLKISKKLVQGPVDWDVSYEDVTIASFASLLSQPAPLLKQVSGNSIPGYPLKFTAWNYRIQEENIEEMFKLYSKFDVVTFGNYSRHHGLSRKDRDARAYKFTEYLLENKDGRVYKKCEYSE